MSALETLAACETAGITLGLTADGRLHYHAPEGLPEDLKALIVANKAGLLALLSRPEPALPKLPKLTEVGPSQETEDLAVPAVRVDTAADWLAALAEALHHDPGEVLAAGVIEPEEVTDYAAEDPTALAGVLLAMKPTPGELSSARQLLDEAKHRIEPEMPADAGLQY